MQEETTQEVIEQLQLPKDLIARGFKLIIRAPDRMFAVSPNRGGTATCATLAEVIRAARKVAGWCEWMDRNRPLGRQKY